MFDKILALFEPEPSHTELPPAEARFAIGALMVRTAMADRAYLFEEVEEIDRVLAKLYDLNPLEAAKMRAQCEKLEHEIPRTKDLAKIIRDAVGRPEQEAALSAMWSVVYADGRRHENEDLLVSRIQSLLEIDTATCLRIKEEQKAAHSDQTG